MLETPPVRQDSRVQTDGYSQFSLNLTSCAAVRKWMREKHVGEDSLPKSVDIFVDADQIEGSMGAQASSGYFAFSLARGDFLSGHINTSFVIVMDLLGTASMALEISWLLGNLEMLEDTAVAKAARATKIGARAWRISKAIK